MAPQIYQRFVVLGALLYVEEETNDTESVPFLEGFRAAAVSWGQFNKYFTDVIYKSAYIVFVPGKPFQPRLMFAGKVTRKQSPML